MLSYVVEKILDVKVIDGKKHYKIEWQGYSADEYTWEPIDHLSTCIGMVEEFEAKRKQAKGVKKHAKKN